MDLPRGKTRALILAPTRELAAQIAEHLTLLARYTKIKVRRDLRRRRVQPADRCLSPRHRHSSSQRPGRLLDHLTQKTATLDGISMLVLDEADRMLDMGFLPDVRRVLRQIPTARQTFFFSATDSRGHR